MGPLIGEHARAVGQEVRELARLHGELASAEVHEGTRSFVRGVLLCGFGILVGTLVLVAAGVALFFLWSQVLTPAGAAGMVALIYLVVGAGALWLGLRLVGGLHAVLLPRTRAMLLELLSCRDRAEKS